MDFGSPLYLHEVHKYAKLFGQQNIGGGSNIYIQHLHVARRLVWSGISRQLIIGLLFFFLWYLISFFKIVPIELLPSPIAVIHDLYNNFSKYIIHLGFTLSAAGYGLLAATLLACLAAFVGSLWHPIISALSSLSVLSQSTPIIAIAPVLVYVYGFSIWTQSIVALLVALFPIGNACAKAVSFCPKEFQDLASVLELNGFRKMRWIDGPRIIEAAFSSLPLSAVLSLIGSIVYEFVQPDKGIGMVIVMSQRNFEEVALFSCVLLVIITGLGVFGLFQCVYFMYRIKRRDLADTTIANNLRGG